MTASNVATACLAAICAVYLGYPVWLMLVAAFMRRPTSVQPPIVPPPPITIIIVAHNESRSIAAKLESVIAARRAYPADVQILVGDDQSSDDTAAIAEQFVAKGVELLRCPRGGKAAALNRVISLALHEVVVLTDADPLFDDATLLNIVAPFADPKVGAVAGVVEVIRARGGSRGKFSGFDALFRRYESALRAIETRLFGAIAADGGLFAIRRGLFPHVPGDVTDDFFISTAAVAEGYRIAHAPDARVFEESITGSHRQFRRRVRITVRGMTGLWRRRALMNPLVTGHYAVGLFMHKLARRVVPVLLLPLWLASGWIALTHADLPRLLWGGMFAGLSLLVLAGLVALAEGVVLPRPLRMAQALALHLAGQITGVLLFLGGRRYSQWTPQK